MGSSPTGSTRVFPMNTLPTQHCLTCPVRISAQPKIAVSIRDAIIQLLQAKSAANLRPTYVNSLRLYLSKFAANREEMPLRNVSPELIESWFILRLEKPNVRASNLGRLSALFSYAVRKQWIIDNPCRRVERVRIDYHSPKILSPTQAARIVQWTVRNRSRCMVWLALALFCGVRKEELQRISRDDIRGNILRIDSCASKVRRKRLVPIPDAAMELIRRGGDLPLPDNARRRYVRRLARLLGMGCWVQDLFRHTAASYMLARDNDVASVARQLGNSPGILLRHYHELVDAGDCETFWNIRP